MTFEEFKNKHFNGDEERAMAQCAYESYHNDFVLSGSKETLSEMINPLKGKQSDLFYKFFKIEIKLEPEVMSQAYAPVLDALGGEDSSWKYDEEFIKKTNPFLKKVKNNLLVALVGVVLMALAYILVKPYQASIAMCIGGLYLVFGVCMAFRLYKSLDNYFEFKKIKKRVENKKEHPQTLDEHLDEVIAIYKKKYRR